MCGGSEKFWVFFLQPGSDVAAKFGGEGDKFPGFFQADAADGIVFRGVALAAAGVEVVGIALAFRTKDERQRLKGAIMGEIFLRAIALGIKKDRAELESRIVGDAELPVVREALGAGVFKIAVGDGEEFGDLRGAGAVGTEPAVALPSLQAHGRLL